MYIGYSKFGGYNKEYKWVSSDKPAGIKQLFRYYLFQTEGPSGLEVEFKEPVTGSLYKYYLKRRYTGELIKMRMSTPEPYPVLHSYKTVNKRFWLDGKYIDNKTTENLDEPYHIYMPWSNAFPHECMGSEKADFGGRYRYDLSNIKRISILKYFSGENCWKFNKLWE